MPDPSYHVIETRSDERVFFYRIEASSKAVAHAEIAQLCEQYAGWDYRAEFRRPMHHPIVGHWSATLDRYMTAEEKISGPSIQ